MKLYKAYLQEIIERAKLGLGAKPIDQGNLLEEIIDIILTTKSSSRDDAVKHFIYNVLPGTTSAASVKAKFLKRLILKEDSVKEIDQEVTVRDSIVNEKALIESRAHQIISPEGSRKTCMQN